MGVPELEIPPASPPASLWNTLEIAKLLVGALTPIAIFIFTYWTNQSQNQQAAELATRRQMEEAKRQSVDKEQAQVNERFAQVVKYRAELWSSISPQMNDLYCYFLYVGHWKELDPMQVLKTKRSLDKLVYSNSPFFSREFLTKYNAFMAEAFLTGNYWGADAKLRSPPIRDKDRGHEVMFGGWSDGESADNTDKIHTAYFNWLSYAGDELELKASRPAKPKTPTAQETADRLSKTQ